MTLNVTCQLIVVIAKCIYNSNIRRLLPPPNIELRYLFPFAIYTLQTHIEYQYDVYNPIHQETPIKYIISLRTHSVAITSFVDSTIRTPLIYSRHTFNNTQTHPHPHKYTIKLKT